MDNLIPLELKVRRDAMIGYLAYLIEECKTNPARENELSAASRVMDDITKTIETIYRQRGQAA